MLCPQQSCANMRIIIGIEDYYSRDQYNFDSLPPCEAFSNYHPTSVSRAQQETLEYNICLKQIKHLEHTFATYM
jgi:hypothetical protein